MKISIAATQDLVVVSSTKKQQANAKILFGKGAKKVLSSLEMYSKEKLLNTAGLDQVLAALKTKDISSFEQFARSSQGKKLSSKCLKFSSLKTSNRQLSVLKTIKPLKSLERFTDQAKTSKARPVRKASDLSKLSWDDIEAVANWQNYGSSEKEVKDALIKTLKKNVYAKYSKTDVPYLYRFIVLDTDSPGKKFREGIASWTKSYEDADEYIDHYLMVFGSLESHQTAYILKVPTSKLDVYLDIERLHEDPQFSARIDHFTDQKRYFNEGLDFEGTQREVVASLKTFNDSYIFKKVDV